MSPEDTENGDVKSDDDELTEVQKRKEIFYKYTI